MLSKFIYKNKIDSEMKQDMLKSFQQTAKTAKINIQNEKEFEKEVLEEQEPSMKWAIKYLELQYKLMETHKPMKTPYPYDFDK